jgi:hypothetical protein
MFSAKRFLAAGVLAAVGGLGLMPATASADSYDRHGRSPYRGGGGAHVVRRYYDNDCRYDRYCDPPVRHYTYTYRGRDCDGPAYHHHPHHRDRDDVRYFRGRAGEVYRYYDR